MFCPKCGTENPDSAQICRACNWVLSSMSAVAPPVDVKTSGLAIASLVLAILSLFTCMISAIPAIILGIVALVKISKSQGQLKGNGLATASIAVSGTLLILLPIIALLMAILMPALARTRQIAQRTVCARNMSDLGKAMVIYINDYGDKLPTPSKWCDLLIEHADVPPSVFCCRGASACKVLCCYRDVSNKLCSYAMNKNVENKNIGKLQPDMVLLFETKPGWNQFGGPDILTTDNHRGDGCNIVFVDCHVDWVKTEDFDDLKWTPE